MNRDGLNAMMRTDGCDEVNVVACPDCQGSGYEPGHETFCPRCDGSRTIRAAAGIPETVEQANAIINDTWLRALALTGIRGDGGLATTRQYHILLAQLPVEVRRGIDSVYARHNAEVKRRLRGGYRR